MICASAQGGFEMFTGIIRDIGKIVVINKHNETAIFTIKSELINSKNSSLGDSIAVNGICLTITAFNSDGFNVEVMPETIQRTNLSMLQNNDPVNLESSLKLNDKLDGHIVLGHIDTTAKLLHRQTEQNSVLMSFSLTKKYQPYVVEKGSIAVDGVSLTVVKVTPDYFQIGLIPFTLKQTILGRLQLNELVNIETDILGKYVVDHRRNDK